MEKEMSPILKAALDYHKRGWSIIPIRIVQKVDIKGGKIEYNKIPVIASWTQYQKKRASREQIIHWWEKYPDAGIALITGAISGQIAIDCDCPEGEATLKERGIPLTPTCSTFKGRHLHLKHPGFEAKNFVKKKGLDLRGDGGYVVMPPTIDPRGGQYQWEISPDEAELAEPPDWLLALIKEQKAAAKMEENEITMLLKGVEQGKRHTTATRLAGHWLGKGLGASETLAHLIDWNKKNEPPLLEEELERIIQDFGKEKKDKVKRGEEFHPRPYSEYILAHYKLMYDDTGRFWYYDKRAGHWKDRFEKYLNGILRKRVLAWPDLTRRRVNEILEDLKGLAHIGQLPQGAEGFPGIVEGFPEAPGAWLIPFNNLIFNLETNQTEKYDSKHFFTHKLRVNYNPEAGEYPKIQKFMEQIVPAKDVITLKELIAYCYYRDYPYAKVFWLHGEGRNGKSKYCEILKKVLGRRNIGAVGLKKLTDSNFGAWGLWNKFANISPETSGFVLRNTDTLKMATGGDLMDMEQKYKDSFSGVSYAKLIMLSNEVPPSRDRSKAFYARCFLLEFPNLFEAKIKANSRIISDIPPLEFEALAYDCLKIMQDLYSRERDFVFTRHIGIDETQIKHDELTDKVGNFLKETTTFEFGSRDNIAVQELNMKLEEWLHKKNLSPMSDKAVARSMADKGHLSRSANIKRPDGSTFTFKAYWGFTWIGKREFEEELELTNKNEA